MPPYYTSPVGPNNRGGYGGCGGGMVGGGHSSSTGIFFTQQGAHRIICNMPWFLEQYISWALNTFSSPWCVCSIIRKYHFPSPEITPRFIWALGPGTYFLVILFFFLWCILCGAPYTPDPPPYLTPRSGGPKGGSYKGGRGGHNSKKYTSLPNDIFTSKWGPLVWRMEDGGSWLNGEIMSSIFQRNIFLSPRPSVSTMVGQCELTKLLINLFFA